MNIDIQAYYERYAPMVLRRCRKLLNDEEQAKDAMQEVFVRLLTYKHRLHGGYPSALLFRMATNVCLNVLRSRAIRQEVDGEERLVNIASYDESEDRAVSEDLLDRIFKREKRSTRAIAVMHYVDGMTLREVAGESGLSVSGVRKRLRKLKERVKSQEVWNEV